MFYNYVMKLCYKTMLFNSARQYNQESVLESSLTRLALLNNRFAI